MIALVRTELLRLRTTRSTWGLLGAAVILTLAGAAAVLAGVGGMGVSARGSVALREELLRVIGVGLFPVLLLGVLSVTGEFHHRTATSTFLVTPNRARVLIAKAVAATLVAVPVAVALLATAWTIGVVAGAVPGSVDGALWETVARAMLVSALWALLGVAVGSAVRNQTLAVILPLLWFLIIESLLPAYSLDRLVPWLPGAATSALFGVPFTGALPAWVALLVLAGYVVALLIPGARGIARRDIS